MMSAFLNVCSLFLYFSIAWLQLFTRMCTDLDWTTDLKLMRRVWDKKRLVLRGPVRKNRTNLGKGGEFDFFYIFMKNRLGYN